MKNIFIKLGVFILPLLSVLIFSCKEDEEISYWELKPEIEEVSVSEGIIGSEVTLTGVHLEEVNKVIFGSVEADDFTVSETNIIATVPDGVFKGELNIAVYSPNGSDRIPFIVLFLPSVTELSTNEAFPGEDVVITGADLEGVTAVTFGGISASFTATANSIATTVPPDAPLGEVQITLMNAGGTTQIPFTVMDDPIVTSFSPTSGAVGDVITISGVNLIDVQSVTIGGIEADFTVESATNIDFVVPEGATTGFIAVATITGESTGTNQFIVQTGDALPVFIYDEGLNPEWDDWGWNSSRDFDNSENPLTGSKALKISHDVDGWGAANFHSDPPFDLIGYKKLTFSVYGGEGTNGAAQTLWVKDATGTEHTKVQFTLKEGEYVTHEFTMEELGYPSNILELYIQNDGVIGNVFYIDDVVLE